MINLQIKCLKSEKAESETLYGRFLITGLRPGQGITIGNLLRRILLGDLVGTCITAVRFASFKHEFSTIKGVREDILEILLNLKGIVLKSKTKEPQFARLKIQGPAVLTADLIQLSPLVEIVNPNHYIATISTSNLLEIELKIEHGTSYKLAQQTFNHQSDGFLQIDAVFMPVKKVDFKIENVYDNSKNVSERLIIDVCTNGSLTPEEAISETLEFVVSFFNSLIESKIIDETTELISDNLPVSLNPYRNIPIEELKLSVRPYNCLKRAQINTIGDLLEYSPKKLQELKNFGRKSADEVFMTLKNKLGIVFK